MFFQAGGIAVVLWGRDKLADDAGIEDRNVDRFGGMALAHNVRSRTEVDEVLGEAANAGAEITRLARETFYGGYAGCFTDPDGHVIPAVETDSRSSRCMKNGMMKNPVPMAVAVEASATCGPTPPSVRKRLRTSLLIGIRSQRNSTSTGGVGEQDLASAGTCDNVAAEGQPCSA